MPSAFVLGGSGQIGRPAARRLAEAGWEVTIGSRSARPVPEGFRHVSGDRAELLGATSGADVLIDVISMTAADAEQPLELEVGSLIAISSASVYADSRGRSLDEAQDEEYFRDLPCPIPEMHPTVAPGEETYSTRKAAMERALLEQDQVPATVVRPCAIHGPYAHGSREWHPDPPTVLETELGYRPVVRYEDAVGETVAWLIEATRGHDWREVLPDVARYMSFDYEAEDARLHSWS